MEEDEDKDPSYFQKESPPSTKNSRPAFKPDAYERLARQQGVVPCDGSEPAIRGRKPYYKYQEGSNWVYLTKAHKEMRPDKVPNVWRKIDKDHKIDYIALIAAAKEMTNLPAPKRDFALRLAYRSTKHLGFLSRHKHKRKKTHRLHNVPLALKNKAKKLLSHKAAKCNTAKYRPLLSEIERAHKKGTQHKWSFTKQ
jgi:hypothetical protein